MWSMLPGSSPDFNTTPDFHYGKVSYCQPLDQREITIAYMYGATFNIHVYIEVVVLASLAQLFVFVELARCARSVRIEIKDV